MSRTACEQHEGHPRRYQDEAARRWYIETGIEPAQWAWARVTCATAQCLTVEHLVFEAPRRLAYPARICVYCGRSAWTDDHLLPKHWSGLSKRTYVLTVPACGTCNGVLSDTLTWSMTERRAICHARLRRRYRKVLRTVVWGESDLDELGTDLRSYVVSEMAKRESVEDMLRWPLEPDYDERYLQQSGIDDPHALGLIISQADALAIAREVA